MKSYYASIDHLMLPDQWALHIKGNCLFYVRFMDASWFSHLPVGSGGIMLWYTTPDEPNSQGARAGAAVGRPGRELGSDAGSSVEN